MTSRHRYILAFLVLSAPLLIWLGYGVIRQEVVGQCFYCNSTHYTIEKHRDIWGARGKVVLRDEVTASRVASDFPELSCDHCWHVVSDKRAVIADSPLFAMSLEPRLEKLIEGHLPQASRYDQEPRLRNAVKAALGRGAVSRQQMAYWLAGRDPQASSPAEKAEFDALSAAFW